MTQDEIIKIAMDAGGYLADLPKGDAWLFNDNQQLERFAALVAAHEREQCAKVCEEVDVAAFGSNRPAPNDCAAAIRARSEK